MVRGQRADVRALRHRPGDVAVAVVTGDLLDHLDLGGDVRPERGRHHVLDAGHVAGGRRREADGCQVGRDGGGVQVRPEDGVDPAGAHPDRLSPGRDGPLVEHPSRRPTGPEHGAEAGHRPLGSDSGPTLNNLKVNSRESLSRRTAGGQRPGLRDLSCDSFRALRIGRQQRQKLLPILDGLLIIASFESRAGQQNERWFVFRIQL